MTGRAGCDNSLTRRCMVAQALIAEAQQLVCITITAAARDSVIDTSLGKMERFENATHRRVATAQPADCRADRAEPAGGGADGRLLERLATRLIPRAFSAGYPGTGL